MGQVLDITDLISLNKALIETRKRMKAVEAEVIRLGDGIYEGKNYRLIVKDGKIDVIQKIGSEPQNKDNNV